MNGMTLTIKGLFGHFNYEIPLYGLDDSDGIPMSDGVTILTGPNGYGKTTILRILEAISKGDLDFFVKLKFEELIVRFEEKPDEWSISKNSQALNINGEALPLDTIAKGQEKGDVFAFNALNAFPDVFMVPEQRLLEIGEISVNPTWGSVFGFENPVAKAELMNTATKVPEKLKGHISEVAARYSATDTKLISSFLTRIPSQSDISFTQGEFNRLYQDMNKKLRTLRENGFSEFAQQDVPAFQSGISGVLRVFFDDFNEKYKVYEPLLNKLTLFRKILDRRFKDFKRVEISSEYGLRVYDLRTDGSDGDEIPLEKLSSGEQETLVLYYQLIFETAENTMLLIDEPEISLHIAWQRTFIDELKEIVRLNKLRAVVATHSSSIIGRHRDIQVDLGALYQDELERQEELNRQGAQPG